VQAGAPTAIVFLHGIGGTTSPPVASHYVQSEDTQHVFFADGKLGTPWEIWWRGSGPKTPENLTKLAGAPETYSPDPFHSLVTADGNQHVIIMTNLTEEYIDLVARP